MVDPKLNQIQKDLKYVRNAVGRMGDAPIPIYSRMMWSIYSLAGFILLDFKPHIGGNFLLIGGLICTILEIIFAATIGRNSRKERNLNRDLRELFQGVAFAVAGSVIVVLMCRGHFTRGYSPGQMFLVLLGYHFVTAGLQFPRDVPLRWNGAIFLGLCLLAGAILVSFYPNGVWSALGVLLAVIISSSFQIPRFLRPSRRSH